ncbi:MAG: hypothetical protein WC299_09540 [Kiritimatiellia bacterium]
MSLTYKHLILRSSHFPGTLHRIASDSDRLLRHSFIVFFFTHAASAANMLFQMVMGWNLSKAEFGVLSSMLGLMMVIVGPMTAISNTLMHYTANLLQEGRTGSIRFLVRLWLNRILLISLPLLFLAIIFRNPLASFFHLSGPWPVILIGIAFFASAFSPVFSGVLQGMQKFTLVGLPSLATGLVRLLIGGVLVLCVAPLAPSGLAAHALAALAGTALVFCFYRTQNPSPPPGNERPLSAEYSDSYFWATLAALLCYSILMNMDVVLVKHYFSNQDTAGGYARASMIGKTLIFLAQPIAGAMFPKVVSRGHMAGEHAFTFFKAIMLSALIVAGGALFCTLFPQVPILILFRDNAPTPEMIALVRFICWAMAPLGLVFILMNFELAQHRMACVVPLAICAAGFIGGVVLFHGSLWQVVSVLLAASMASLAALIIISFRSFRYDI